LRQASGILRHSHMGKSSNIEWYCDSRVKLDYWRLNLLKASNSVLVFFPRYW
jgi:hypothetical protein